VDTGAKPLAKTRGETVTGGLDGLRERLSEYREIGARFSKWRAVIRVGSGLPSRSCIRANAHALGHYATLAQEAGLVPIVEPEVLMDGDHDIQRSQEVTEQVLLAVFDELSAQRCLLEGIILKPNMVTPGSDSRAQVDATEVAMHTLATLRRRVPAAVPGIAFLSGGQSGEEACANLNAMVSRGPQPWELSFSFGRALQYPALQIWAGEAANVPAAQLAFLHRSRMSSLARAGTYSERRERALV
jgi:fructose-bisphosphate aldolase class I